MIGAVQRRPISAFVVLMILGVLPLMSVPILASRGVLPGGSLLEGMDVERVASVVGVAALTALMTWVLWTVEGPAGVRRLARRLVPRRIGAGGWLVVLGLPPFTVLLGLLFGRSLQSDALVSVVAHEFVAVVVAFGLINLWEEAVWAGFVQHRLERRHRLAPAAFLTAIPFVVFHLPLQFVEKRLSVAALVGAAAGLLILAVTVRLLIALTLRGVGGSVVAVALLHTMFNRANNVDGLAADLLSGGDHGAFSLLATLVVLAGAAIAWRHRPASDTPSSVQYANTAVKE